MFKALNDAEILLADEADVCLCAQIKSTLQL